MIDEDRIAALEKRADKLENNDKGFAEAIKSLMQSSLHHSEMMDDFFRGMNELREALVELKDNQANTDVKISALVDAQIKAEDELKEMRAGINQLSEGMSELRDFFKEMAQAIISTNKRVDDIEKPSE